MVQSARSAQEHNDIYIISVISVIYCALMGASCTGYAMPKPQTMGIAG